MGRTLHPMLSYRRMPRLALAVLALLLVAGTGAARELAGVDVPDTVSEAGTTLRLNGAGIRTKFFFKVYVAALYLAQKQTDPAAVVRANEVKRIDLHMLRALDAHTIADSIAEGFARNSGTGQAALQDRLERLKRMFPSVQPGDVVTLAFVPERGTVVRAQDAERGVIEGKDFADALFAVWLGARPVSEDLERALLGG